MTARTYPTSASTRSCGWPLTELEALADQLYYAQAERDVVTKRMIAMEIERATKEDTE